MMMNNKKKTKRKREREGEKIECHCGPIEKSSDQNGGRASLRLSLLNVARLFQPPTPLLPPCPSGRCRLDGGGAGYHQLVLRLVLLRSGGEGGGGGKGGGIGSSAHCGFFASALDTNPPAPFQVDSRVNFQVD